MERIREALWFYSGAKIAKFVLSPVLKRVLPSWIPQSERLIWKAANKVDDYIPLTYGSYVTGVISGEAEKKFYDVNSQETNDDNENEFNNKAQLNER